MMSQANGISNLRTAKRGLHAPAFARSAEAVPPKSSSGPLGFLKNRKRGAAALLSGALLASVATPVLAAADMSGAIVAAPLFLAGIAVAAVSLLALGRTKHEPVRSNLDGDTAKACSSALPLADVFDASAFVVTPAGTIVTANQLGMALTEDLVQRCDPPVLFDLFSPASRSDAMAALTTRRGAPVEVRLRDGTMRKLHIVATENEGHVIAVFSAANAAEPVADVKSGGLSEAMLATVSHELRTPLNAIIGFSGILENELFGKLGSERQREYVGLIQSSGRHLLAVVNDILDVSKIEAGAYQLNCEHFLLDEVVEEASAMVRCQAGEKSIALELEGPPGGTKIHGDRRAVKHMLVNLLANAVKFTEKGSVTLSWQRAGRDLKLSVADTGIGIPADQIGKLGAPFVQASCGLTRKYEGTGLGLAYVRGMSELHGGSMMITSQEGAGTIVTLDLPLVPRQATNLEDQNIVALNHARKHSAEGHDHAAQRLTA